MTLAVTVAAALIAGLLIGLTGIGGVLLVPVLTQVGGIPLDRAIAASMLGFVLAGVYAAFVHLRRARLETRPVVALCLAAAAGAVAGAATLDWLPGTAVRLFIALLCLASGAYALLFRRAPKKRILSPMTLAMLGALIGYASAISGTGGPVTLIPVLLFMGTPAGAAIALGLAAQLPIAISASVVYALDGRIDLELALALGALLVIGTYAGARLSGRLSGRRLTVAVALTLVAVGAWFGAQAL
jgi:uncharacterized membrane protein YfcA